MSTNIRKASAIQLVQDPNPITVRRVSAVAFSSDVGATVRAIQGYAFETPPAGGTLRAIQGYAFETVPAAIPTSKTGDLLMYDLINSNRQVTTVFSASNTTLGAPTALGTPDARGHNTSVTLSAKSGSGYSGSTTFYYTRRPIGDLNPASLSLGSIPSATTVWALLATINTKYGWNLTQSDVLNTAVPANATSLPLTAGPNSYLFVPGSVVGIGVQWALASVVTATALSGFDNAAGVGPRTRTLALLHFDGTNGSTVFADQTGRVWTPSGAAAISTASPFFGTGSYSNNGANQNVSTPDAPELRLTGDFTIECFYRQTTAGSAGIILSKTIGNLARVQWNSNNTISVYDDTGTALLTSGTLSAATWYHVAVVKISGTAKLYINGALVATSASFGTFGNSTAPFNLGSGQNNSSAPMFGNLDEVRISPFGRYTANFTTPNAPFVLD